MSQYNTPEAELYREQLKARRDGLPIPTEVKQRAQSQAQSTEGSGSRVGRPGETPEERELRLREEARERLRAKFGSNSMRGQGIGSSGETMAPKEDGDTFSAVTTAGVAHVKNASAVAADALTSTFSWLTVKASWGRDGQTGTTFENVSSSWSAVHNKINSGELQQNVSQVATEASKSVSRGWSSLVSSVWGNEEGNSEGPQGAIASGDASSTAAAATTSNIAGGSGTSDGDGTTTNYPRAGNNASSSNGNLDRAEPAAVAADDDAWLQEQLKNIEVHPSTSAATAAPQKAKKEKQRQAPAATPAAPSSKSTPPPADEDFSELLSQLILYDTCLP